MSGPRIGDTIANGAIVINKYANTLLFASVGETEKKSDPAKETVTSVSPAIMITCTSAKRPNAVDWSNRSCAEARKNEPNPRLRTNQQ